MARSRRRRVSLLARGPWRGIVCAVWVLSLPAIATPADPGRQDWHAIASSANGTMLAAVVKGGHVWTSADAGASWTQRASSRNWFSIASSANGTMLAAVVNGGYMYTSTDAGASWTQRASYRNWWSIASSADGTMLAAVVTGGGHVWTSADAGASWTQRASNPNWWSIASSANGTMLAAGVYGGYIYTSTDAGASWTPRASSQGWRSIASSADGTLLAAVVPGGDIYTSTEAGAVWRYGGLPPPAPPLPPPRPPSIPPSLPPPSSCSESCYLPQTGGSIDCISLLDAPCEQVETIIGDLNCTSAPPPPPQDLRPSPPPPGTPPLSPPPRHEFNSNCTRTCSMSTCDVLQTSLTCQQTAAIGCDCTGCCQSTPTRRRELQFDAGLTAAGQVCGGCCTARPPSLPPAPFAPPPPPFNPPGDTQDFFVVATATTLGVLFAAVLTAWCFSQYKSRRARSELLLELQDFRNSSNQADKEIYVCRPGSDDRVQLITYLTELLRSSSSPSSAPPASHGPNMRFSIGINHLQLGQQTDAAHGVGHFLNVPERALQVTLAAEPLASLRSEWLQAEPDILECIEYVLNRRAGSLDRIFPNSQFPPDCDAYGVREDRTLPSGEGMSLQDFANLPECRDAKLELHHVAAVRIYSTAAFRVINEPLRDTQRTDKHPYPATVMLLTEALRKLRIIGAKSPDANKHIDLWRGMRDLDVAAAFGENGGTELAPMSTTTDLKVAIGYSEGGQTELLLKLSTASAVERGVDIAFLSVFPAEAEVLFPPLTYLRPTPRVMEEVRIYLTYLTYRVFTVIEVVPVPGGM